MQLYELLIPRVARAEQKKLLRGKADLKAQMQPQLLRLQGWLQGGYVGFDELPVSVLHADAATWRLGGLVSHGRADIGTCQPLRCILAT